MSYLTRAFDRHGLRKLDFGDNGHFFVNVSGWSSSLVKALCSLLSVAYQWASFAVKHKPMRYTYKILQKSTTKPEREAAITPSSIDLSQRLARILQGAPHRAATWNQLITMDNGILRTIDGTANMVSPYGPKSTSLIMTLMIRSSRYAIIRIFGHLYLFCTGSRSFRFWICMS